MRCWNQFGLFVQYENDWCNNRCLCVAVENGNLFKIVFYDMSTHTLCTHDWTIECENERTNTHNDGCINSIAVGVQAPRINRSSNFVNPAPFPFNVPIMIMITYAFGYNLAACVTPSWIYLQNTKEHTHNGNNTDARLMTGAFNYLLASINFLHGACNHFHRQELRNLWEVEK